MLSQQIFTNPDACTSTLKSVFSVGTQSWTAQASFWRKQLTFLWSHDQGYCWFKENQYSHSLSVEEDKSEWGWPKGVCEPTIVSNNLLLFLCRIWKDQNLMPSYYLMFSGQTSGRKSSSFLILFKGWVTVISNIVFCQYVRFMFQWVRSVLWGLPPIERNANTGVET